MIRSTNRLTLAAALALALGAGAARAQDSDPEAGAINQLQLNDVWAAMDVYVPESTGAAVSTATSLGNTAAALRISGDVSSEITQTFDARSTATNRLRGYSAGTTR